METAIKVVVWEFEREWGSKIDDYMVCSTMSDAEDFRKDFNSKNDLPSVPDWYMVAQDIIPMKLTKVQMDFLLKAKNKRCWLSQLKNIK